MDAFDASGEAKKRALWLVQRREKQAPPPGDWDIWMVVSGRGFGKTRLAAEWLWWRAYRAPRTRWAIVAPTFADGRDTCIEGDSGILRCAPDGFVKTYNRSMGEIIFSNGSRGKVFSAEEPERLRGPQHHGAWIDEFAAMDNQEETWDQLNFGLRLGKHPQVVITTTPKPTKLMKELMGRGDNTVAVTVGTTFENAANLAPSTLEALKRRYEGTRLGRQELYGELLGDVEGALWNRDLIPDPETPPKAMLRLVVAVDPPGGGRAEAGLIVAGVDWDQRFWVLADHSGRMSPNEWAGKAIELYREHRADCVVAERNFGGVMVESTILQAVETVRRSHPWFEVPVRLVTASRGKQQRAEPIVALYEQGRVRHVKGLDLLEEQMVEWIPGEGDSPDRVDAAVWALHELSESPALLPVAPGGGFQRSYWR